MSNFNINQNDYFVYNKAVQDLTEKIRTACSTYTIGTDRKTGDLIYAHSDGTWHNLLDDVTRQMMKSVQETREPVYELYQKEHNKFNLRTCFYNKEQVQEFAATVGRNIVSASSVLEMVDRIEKEGKFSFIWDISLREVAFIPSKYLKTIPEGIDWSSVFKIAECVSKYLKVNSNVYLWINLGVNSAGELTYLHTNGKETIIRGIMGSDGYPDILNDKNESVFDYAEEMNMTPDMVNEIRGISKVKDEKDDMGDDIDR